MNRIHLVLGLMLLAGFGATGAAFAQTAAAVEGDGACNYDGNEASDEAGVTIGADEQTVDEPDPATVQAALDNCIAAASNGELPGSSSKLELSLAVADGAGTADLSTVPLSNLATEQEGSASNAAAAEGACNPRDGGASDSASATLGTDEQGASEPAPENAQSALEACLTSGDVPQGGSHLSGGVSLANGAASVGFSTVPISAASP